MEFQQPSEEHLRVLRQNFRIPFFKKEQWAIIRGIMYEKRDCCIIASTGFGKSLIYQFPPIFMNKITIVISPLCALMADQVLSLHAKGISACYLGSMQADKSLRLEDHSIVYITPEYFCSRHYELKPIRHKIMMFAIDEAHLIDQWCDFRKSYGKLNGIREKFPEIPIVALTATAPQYVQNVIIESLQLKNHIFVRTFLDRPNLEFIIRRKGAGYMTDVFPLLRNLKEGSAIVYCLSRDLTDEMSQSLNENGIPSQPFHAHCTDEHKKKVINDFRTNKLRFVTCTIAYGMGIDKGDVRLVAHYGVSKTIEAYYQEAGRAGRDGNPSQCILFYDSTDYIVLKNFVNISKDTKAEKKKYLLQLIDKVSDFVKSKNCRRLELLNYLGTTEEELKKITIRSNCCDNCKYDLLYNIPPHLQYQGIDVDGTFNCTKDSSALLQAVNKRLLRAEIVNLLIGNTPTKEIHPMYKLKVFGLGRERSKDWWNSFISLLIQNQYLHVVGNTLRLDQKAKKFLYYKGSELKISPSHQLLKFFEKKDDIELFWLNDKVESRPKIVEVTKESQELTSQATMETFLESDEFLDDNALLEISKIEDDDKLDQSLRKNTSGKDKGEASSCGESSKKRVHSEKDDERHRKENINKVMKWF